MQLLPSYYESHQKTIQNSLTHDSFAHARSFLWKLFGLTIWRHRATPLLLWYKQLTYFLKHNSWQIMHVILSVIALFKPTVITGSVDTSDHNTDWWPGEMGWQWRVSLVPDTGYCSRGQGAGMNWPVTMFLTYTITWVLPSLSSEIWHTHMIWCMFLLCLITTDYDKKGKRWFEKSSSKIFFSFSLSVAQLLISSFLWEIIIWR